MTSATTVSPADSRKPLRADARHNYEKLLVAAREAFGEFGSSASLEDIAKKAGVGIGTLYRHFPARQDLIEAVYVDQVNELCAAAATLASLPPWEAFSGWIRGFVGYVATKRALREVLLASHDSGSEFFTTCRTDLYTAGEPLLSRAQGAGVVRGDATIGDVLKLISGVTMVDYDEPAQLDRVLGMAIDGLRITPAAK
jgi:AcrR family transcriptional regulator